MCRLVSYDLDMYMYSDEESRSFALESSWQERGETLYRKKGRAGLLFDFYNVEDCITRKAGIKLI